MMFPDLTFSKMMKQNKTKKLHLHNWPVGAVQSLDFRWRCQDLEMCNFHHTDMAPHSQTANLARTSEA